MEYVEPAALIIAGVVQIAPIMGVAGKEVLVSLYDVQFNDDESMVVLMRHRAVLLSIVGLVLLLSLYHKPFRPSAILVALISKLSFIALFLSSGVSTASPLQSVARVDMFTSSLLIISAIVRHSRHGVPDRSKKA